MDQNVTGRSENRKNKVHNNEGKVLTLWAVEDASLGTGLDGLVQASVEGSIGSSTKVMVGLDVLLDGDARRAAAVLEGQDGGLSELEVRTSTFLCNHAFVSEIFLQKRV